LARLLRTALGAAALIAAGSTCILPTDRSDELEVELEILPTLFVRDTIDLRARLMGPGGEPVPNALITFSSDDPTVVNVSPSGELIALGVGITTVRASAAAYEEAAVATRAAQVRGLLEVDSIRPLDVSFGQLVEIFGVGLNPDSLFSVTIGEADAPIAGFTPQDPNAPDKLGRLVVWVAPPAERQAELMILGFKGGLVFPEGLTVAQQDLFEPNDTIPTDLGPLPAPGFRNPGLAFEARVRTEVETAADWYRFENETALDRTIVVFSQMVGAETFSVFVTDSLAWDGEAAEFGVGSSAWGIGRGRYLCDGLPLTQGPAGDTTTFAEIPFPFTIVSLLDLPAGPYDVIVPFTLPGEPVAYELVVVPAHLSVADLAPDALEENDYCDVAAPLADAAGQRLTIDNTHDVEWFDFSLTQTTQVSVSVTADTEDADLDIYVIRDFRPDSLRLIAARTTDDPTESISQPFAAGDYFLVVFDFSGVPTPYDMDVTLGAAPSDVAPVQSATAAELEALRRKRERGAATPAPGAAMWLDRLRAVLP
jgi:hypothetical protein